MKQFMAVMVVLFSLPAPAGFGQATDSNLVGVVIDATGAAIQNGFATSSLKGISLELNKTATAHVPMQVGTVATALEVSETAVTIDTTTAQVGPTYESRQIVDLPIIENANGLFGALQLSLLSAGVASNGGVGQGTGPSVGGQRAMHNNFVIEGVDNNNKASCRPHG